MSDPEVIKAGRLGDDQVARLREITGVEYQYALRCGEADDGAVCLADGDGVDGLFDRGTQVSYRNFSKGKLIKLPDKDRDWIINSIFRVYDAKPASSGAKVVPNGDLNSRAPVVSPVKHEAIEVIERNEPDEVRERRLETLLSNYERLTPALKRLVGVVDLRAILGKRREEGVSGFAHPILPYIRIGIDGLHSANVFFHEVAHILSIKLTLEEIKEWNAIAGDVYIGDECFDNEHTEAKKDIRDGMISWYAYRNWEEDISELTSAIYVTPGYVRWMAQGDARMKSKVIFLLMKGYISKEQFAFVLSGYEGRGVVEEWKEIAGEVYIGKEAASKLGEVDLWRIGFISAESADDPEKDIEFLRTAIEKRPYLVRIAAEDSAAIAAKLNYLFENGFITEKAFYYVMSEEMPDAPDLPPVDQPFCEWAKDGSFWDSAECYFDIGLETSVFLMNPITWFI